MYTLLVVHLITLGIWFYLEWCRVVYMVLFLKIVYDTRLTCSFACQKEYAPVSSSVTMNNVVTIFPP